MSFPFSARREIKISIIFFLAFGALLFFLNSFTQSNSRNVFILDKNLRILHEVAAKIDQELNNQKLILERNYDYLENLISLQRKNIADTLAAKLLGRGRHMQTRGVLLSYQNEFETQEKYIQIFKILSSNLKAEEFYLARILKQQETSFFVDNHRAFILMSNIYSLLDLIRSLGNDSAFQKLKYSEQKLAALAVRKQDRETKELFLKHIRNYIRLYPQYHLYFQKATNNFTSNVIGQAMETFAQENENLLRIISYLHIFLMFSFTLAIVVIIYFLLFTEKEKEKLILLKKELEYVAYFSSLTGLRNRASFHVDVSSLKQPVCLLVNIDGFKHINDFYGIPAGDHILKSYAAFFDEVIGDICPQAITYHLGADDFALIFDESYTNDPHFDRKIAEAILRTTNHENFYYSEIEILVQVSIGIARGDNLLEKADMVLKYIKRYTRVPYLEYRENLNLHLLIESNLKTITYIKEALAQDRIVPFFQPILNNRTSEILKFECLARIEGIDGEYILPQNFFDVAKGTNYYREITTNIIQKSVDYFWGTGFSFSVNISIQDILDQKLSRFIEQIFIDYQGISSQITFEILESEQIADYAKVGEFIHRMKSYGCSFAIDDFGSGYSNFHHLLNLDIDYIKLDGSLIKNITSDLGAQMLVRMIAEFAQVANIKTIAEYVHNKEVYEIVKDIGIDYSQGYYLYKPLANVTSLS